MKETSAVVIWGLRTSTHSHRYIHAGWYRTLQNAGYRVSWTDDRASSVHALEPGAVVLGVNVASKYLPFRADCKYVLHNIDSAAATADMNIAPRILHLQVWTAGASGRALEPNLACVRFDENLNILFQPWGTPFLEKDWVRSPLKGSSKREFWIGSVWNNELKQGNSAAIASWREALKRAGLTFTKVPRGWPDSPHAYRLAVRKSAVGASIVGEWQAQNQYLPCRMFKNLSFGVLPTGNNDGYTQLFGDDAISSHNFDDLVATAQARVRSTDALVRCQTILTQYTHLAALQRMFKLVELL